MFNFLNELKKNLKIPQELDLNGFNIINIAFSKRCIFAYCK